MRLSTQAIKALSYLGLSLSVAALIYWGSSLYVLKKPGEIEKDQIDEYMIDILVKKYNKDGLLGEKLEVEGVYHRYGDDHMNLIHPKLMMNRQDGATWVLHSKSGKSYQKDDQHFEKIDLTHEIQMEIQGVPNTQWQLTTDELTIYPREEKAHTDSLVHLTSSSVSMTSHGMVCDFKTGILDLLSQVKTHYDPTTL